jgi:glyoxylase-like metal-dependent hydrolase (beta-lactamase superfamily II)
MDGKSALAGKNRFAGCVEMRQRLWVSIPLEDCYYDILGKAQRGLKLTDADLASRVGIPEKMLAKVKEGSFDSAAVGALAAELGLNARALIALGEGTYQPAEVSVKGLAGFNSPFGDMTVNSYVIWDEATKEAAIFDTGADASELLDFLGKEGLTTRFLLLTHTHGDHILELDRVVEKTGAAAYVGDKEPALEGATAFPAGKTFQVGSLGIETRLTWGHAQGGITYVVHGLERVVAVVGDAVFAGSMGGGGVSYADALRTNREEIMSLPDETVLAPGHGPLTTVGEQKVSNPFLAA